MAILGISTAEGCALKRCLVCCVTLPVVWELWVTLMVSNAIVIRIKNVTLTRNALHDGTTPCAVVSAAVPSAVTWSVAMYKTAQGNKIRIVTMGKTRHERLQFLTFLRIRSPCAVCTHRHVNSCVYIAAGGFSSISPGSCSFTRCSPCFVYPARGNFYRFLFLSS